MIELTPWFPANVKPVRPGWYEVRENPANRPGTRSLMRLRGGMQRYWTGTKWLCGWRGSSFASMDNMEPSIFGQHRSHQWRGLAQEPKQ